MISYDLVRKRPGCAIGLRPWIPDKPLETYHPETTHLTATCSCEACSTFTRVAARTLAPSPICDQLHRRLQPFRHLHDCSGCFRQERFAGWVSHPLESAAFSRRTQQAVIPRRRGERVSRCRREDGRRCAYASRRRGLSSIIDFRVSTASLAHSPANAPSRREGARFSDRTSSRLSSRNKQ